MAFRKGLVSFGVWLNDRSRDNVNVHSAADRSCSRLPDRTADFERDRGRFRQHRQRCRCGWRGRCPTCGGAPRGEEAAGRVVVQPDDRDGDRAIDRTLCVVPEAAFEVLRRASRNSNRTLHDIAADLIVSGDLLAPPPRSNHCRPNY
ncbi:ANTAR domain-containing protein [Microlunatus soli]|uniref:ANTAR domain-containing protein n=1 Tax=Microlunatus soli TaxID=630515 RepID=UPI0038B3EC05